MKSILLTPPIVFLIYLILSLCISKFSTLLSAIGNLSAGKEKAYACGENVQDNRVQPGFSQFFPFAMFFTLMHVVALIVTTVPSGIPVMAVLYLIVAVISIYILVRR